MTQDSHENNILLNRIDERVAALKEGGERTRADIEMLMALRAKVEYLTADDYSALRQLMQQEIRIHEEKKGVRLLDFAGIALGVASLLISLWAKSGA
jgi:hypothetical protein